MSLYHRLLLAIEKIGASLPSVSAHDTDRLEGLTPKEITQAVTAADVGLRYVLNIPTQKTFSGSFTTLKSLTPKATEELIQAARAEALATESNHLLVIDSTKTPPVRKAAFFGAVGFCYGSSEFSTTTATGLYPYVYDVLAKVLHKQLSGTTYEAQTEAVRQSVLKNNQWYHNTVTNRLFYAENIDSVISF